MATSGRARMLAVAAAQDGSFFLIGGTALEKTPSSAGKSVDLTDAYRYDPKEAKWRQIADVPRNVAAALLFLLDQDLRPGEKVNIVGQEEVDNLTLAMLIAKVAGKDLKYKLVDFHSSRPGHDLRYALDGSKLAGMGFELPMDFQQSMEKTIRWMLDNPRWLEG
ncbi:hypothetical protein LCGC14_2957720 [marine sediment metagenome]|uniref:NAD-dependent epimerase/dehydratase domain-containing protein n=1 Tax=marine sediment metagenome TaxID=412755 RepID=A0A0F8ZKY7_9ZZZZ